MTKVPFFRPSVTEAEIDEVVQCLRSGWLTTGPRTKAFEQAFVEFSRRVVPGGLLVVCGDDAGAKRLRST